MSDSQSVASTSSQNDNRQNKLIVIAVRNDGIRDGTHCFGRD